MPGGWRIWGMLHFDYPEDEQTSTLHVCSKIGLACFCAICALVVFQAITGTLLAVKCVSTPPALPQEREQVVEWCSAVRSAHAVAGQLALVPAFVVFALSILFMLNVGNFDTRHTRFMWAQLLRSLLLCLILMGISLGGRLYGDYLRGEGFWLTETSEPAGESAGATIDAVSSTGFYTFVALHGIVLPFLAIISIIFMWPAFYEFAIAKMPAALTRWTKLDKSAGPAASDIEDLPTGWSSLARMADKKRTREDE
jgi:hypothetical protein